MGRPGQRQATVQIYASDSASGSRCCMSISVERAVVRRDDDVRSRLGNTVADSSTEAIVIHPSRKAPRISGVSPGVRVGCTRQDQPATQVGIANSRCCPRRGMGISIIGRSGNGVGCDRNGGSCFFNAVIHGPACIRIVPQNIVECPAIAIVGSRVRMRCFCQRQATAEIQRIESRSNTARRTSVRVISRRVRGDCDGGTRLANHICDGTTGIGIVSACILECPGIARVNPCIRVSCSGQRQATAQIDRPKAGRRSARHMDGRIISHVVPRHRNGCGGLTDDIINQSAGVGIVPLRIVECPGVPEVNPRVGVCCSRQCQSTTEINPVQSRGRPRRCLCGRIVGRDQACHGDRSWALPCSSG